MHHHCHPMEGYVDSYANHMPPDSGHILPVFAQVGKGLRGDSFTVEYDNSDAANPTLKGIYHDLVRDQDTEQWSINMIDFAPNIECEVHQCVNYMESFDKYMLGYYVRTTCSVMNTNLWTFDTPFVPIQEYVGEDYEYDEVIDSTGGE